MRYLLLILFLFASLTARSEQRVLYVYGYFNEAPDLHQVERLLTLGWRVVHVSSTGPGNTARVHFIFVLESPAPASVQPVSAPK